MAERRETEQESRDRLAYWRGKVDQELKSIGQRLEIVEETLLTLRDGLNHHAKFISKIVGIGIVLAMLLPLIWSVIAPLLLRKP